MKNLMMISLMLLMGSAVFSQNKNAHASVTVDGVCGMCKERIEKAAVKTKGVKHANWSVESHELKLIYNENKTDLSTIQQNIAKSGHDTQDFKADDAVYESIDECCKYRDPQVVDDHKDGGH